MTPTRARDGQVQADILLVIGSLQCGGAERVLSGMADYWSRKGWRVTLATWSGPETADYYELDPAVRRVWLDVGVLANSALDNLRSNLLRIRKLRRLLKSEKPDAVLSFLDTSNVLTILAAAGLNTRTVVSERVHPAANPTISPVWKLLRRVFYSWSDVVVAQSTDAAKWIVQHCRKAAVVVPNPLRPLPELKCARQPLIVGVGRLTNQKGFDLLIRAFAQIATDFEDWNVAIIGEGDERNNLMRLRDEHMLTERVEFVGQVKDVEQWMARAGLVVQPSRFEGFPNVLLESMGMGTAVISSDCPSGPSEIITDGVNGRLVPVEDVATLVRVMTELMSQPKVRESLGEEALRTSRHYRQELVMARWEACILGTRCEQKSFR